MSAAPVPPLPPRCGSWVVIRRADGKAVFETFEARTVARLDPAKAYAAPALDYLQALNARIRQGSCA